jgi:hypothetical protein
MQLHMVSVCFGFWGSSWSNLPFASNSPSPLSTMAHTAATGAWDDPIKGHPFMLEAPDVHQVGLCSKASYNAIGYLLEKAASKPGMDCVVLQRTMPDGSVHNTAVHPPDDKWLALGLPSYH